MDFLNYPRTLTSFRCFISIPSVIINSAIACWSIVRPKNCNYSALPFSLSIRAGGKIRKNSTKETRLMRGLAAMATDCFRLSKRGSFWRTYRDVFTACLKQRGVFAAEDSIRLAVPFNWGIKIILGSFIFAAITGAKNGRSQSFTQPGPICAPVTVGQQLF
jgi:hypothetical protein